MPSRVAQEIAEVDRARAASLTPAERVELTRRLSDEGLASYMAAHGLDRSAARARIAASRRAGRPRSSSSEQR